MVIRIAKKHGLSLGLFCFTAFVLVSCSRDDPRYTSFSNDTGTYRLDGTTGEIHQIVDNRLVEIVEDAPMKTETLTQAAVIEDFEIVIRFLDGNYDTSVGEYGVLDCVQDKPIDASLSTSRIRAELANVLVTCMDETLWFETERPAPKLSDSNIPTCKEGRKNLANGGSICISEGEDCDHDQYLGDGVFVCKADN